MHKARILYQQRLAVSSSILLHDRVDASNKWQKLSKAMGVDDPEKNLGGVTSDGNSPTIDEHVHHLHVEFCSAEAFRKLYVYIQRRCYRSSSLATKQNSSTPVETPKDGRTFLRASHFQWVAPLKNLCESRE